MDRGETGRFMKSVNYAKKRSYKTPVCGTFGQDGGVKGAQKSAGKINRREKTRPRGRWLDAMDRNVKGVLKCRNCRRWKCLQAED
jgi:hypothetical protein